MIMKINNELLKEISSQYGNAFYLLDTEQFILNYNELLSEFKNIYPKSNIAYSYKTNYIPRLCKLINDLGGYAETVSDMEVELAKTIGVIPTHIAYNGPYKNPKTLSDIVLSGVNVNIDSLEEFELIKNIANKNPDSDIKIGIRCNFDVDDNVLSRFGFDVDGEDFKEVFSMIDNITNLKIDGFHCHFATRDLKTWPQRATKMLKLISDVYSGIPRYICLGGGLYGKMEDSLKRQFFSKIPTYKEYAEAVAPLLKEAYSYLPYDKQPTLFIEPGSALVGDCMKFVSKVVSIKNVRGKNIATLLGSIYNINPTLNKKNPPIKRYAMGKTEKEYLSLDFGGFTCIETDYLYKDYNGSLAVGDYIVFSNVGSYSIVLKPPFILPNFAILELNNQGEYNLVKAKEKFDDLFHTYAL